MDYVLVGLGGFLGANARYLLARWLTQYYGTAFPYATLVINVTGSFVIGFFLVLATERFVLRDHWRLGFVVGFLGAYTTFSTFSFENLVLLQHGFWGRSLLYMSSSVVLGLLAAGTGAALARVL